jgi:hypothetical protein
MGGSQRTVVLAETYTPSLNRNCEWEFGGWICNVDFALQANIPSFSIISLSTLNSWVESWRKPQVVKS